MLGNNSGTTPCPDCGKPMGLVTWTGPKPSCPACSGASTTGNPFEYGTSEQPCLHEGLERSLPPNQRSSAHALACPCPKCSVIC